MKREIFSEFLGSLLLAAAVVGSGIMAERRFTASTSFANPAITVGRSISDTFAGIRPADASAFIVAQLVGAAIGWVLVRLVASNTAFA